MGAPRLDLLGLPGVTACADISDGLIADLGHICRASGVAAEVDLPAVPLADPAGDAAAQISGGDDYCLVFTIETSSKASLPAGCQAIGTIIPAVQDQPRVRLSGEAAIAAQIEARAGYTHF